MVMQNRGDEVEAGALGVVAWQRIWRPYNYWKSAVHELEQGRPFYVEVLPAYAEPHIARWMWRATLFFVAVSAFMAYSNLR
jgi:hypothetical protein